MQHLKLSLCFFFLGAVWVTAANTTLSLSIDPRAPVIGDQVSIKATLTNPQGNGQIGIQQTPKTPGLNIQWNRQPSTSQNTTMHNGRFSSQYVLTWSGRATQKGTFTLSPLKLQIGGKTITSNSLKYTITAAQKSNLYLLKTHLSKKECFVGESIEYHIDYLISEQEVSKYERYSRGYEMANNHYGPFSIPQAWKDNFHVKAKFFRSARGESELFFGSPVANQKVNNFVYRVHRITFLLEPKKSGKLILPALKTQLYKLKASRDFFGFGNQLQRGQAVPVSAPALSLTVAPPPSEGRPASFTGIICESMQAKLKVMDIKPGQKVMLHSPRSIELEIQTELPPDGLLPPVWSAQKELNKNFKVSHQSTLEEKTDRSMIFKEIIIRPKDVNATEIPAIELSYFQASTKKYVTIKTKPFPISIEAVAITNQDDESPLQIFTQPQKEKKESIGRVSGIEVSTGLLNQVYQKKYSWWLFMPLIIAPWLLWVILYIYHSLRANLKIKKEKGRYGLQDSIQKLSQAQKSSEILELLSRYTCHKWKVTDPNMVKFKSNPELKQELADLLEELSAASYAGQSSGDEELKNKTRVILQKLNKEGLQ
ncbi:MAG: BatD family protein [Planctomycetes bacterium]|nr:BatD family protein [Planctomycetota bacterium]